MPVTEIETKLPHEKSVEEAAGKRQKNQIKSKRERRLRASVIVLSVIMSLFMVMSGLYAFVVYSNLPFIQYWRNIWIETAMTTKSHLWLAEYFFPADMIEEVMDVQKPIVDVIGGLEHLQVLDGSAGYEETPIHNTGKPGSSQNGNGTGSKPQVQEPKPVVDDILGQKELSVGEKDYAGNTVLINDIEEGIVVSEIIGDGYKGQVMLVDDPSRVYIGMTQYPGIVGMRILEMMDHYDAVAAVNASGFQDPNENGNGGEVVGMSVSEGQYWGSYAKYYSSMVLTTDDKLVVGNIPNWSIYGNIRDGMQFSPALIANGQKLVEGSAGYGLQPRTAVGQRADGVIVFLVVDGRDVTHSLGCTVGDMADELLKYGVINASSCDGGATTALAYKGKVLNKNCSWHPELGRILPNAFMVRSKADAEE